ncbi:MAG: hypothetical protein AB2A00_08540 [Myxococcota bacterium]
MKPQLHSSQPVELTQDPTPVILFSDEDEMPVLTWPVEGRPTARKSDAWKDFWEVFTG